MNLQLLWPALIGFGVGGVFSIVLGIYSKPTADSYTREIFGVSSFFLIKYISVLVASFVIILSAGFSILIRDLDFPKQHPGLFSIEVLYAAFVPALLIILMTYTRNKSFSKNTVIDFSLLTAKFGIAHLLLQVSGVYQSVFGL